MTRAAAVVALALTACGCPLLAGELPGDKRDYAGPWEGENVRLHISDSGEVDYERRRGNATVSVSGPISAWNGDDFVVGIWIFETEFDVSEPPHLDAGQWWMTVDGVTLARPSTGP